MLYQATFSYPIKDDKYVPDKTFLVEREHMADAILALPSAEILAAQTVCVSEFTGAELIE